MRVSAKALAIVAVSAAFSALPLAFVFDGMHLSAVSLSLVAGSGLSSAAWLAALVARKSVRRLGIVTGALLGFLSFATVLLVFLSLPAEPGATATTKDRAMLAFFAVGGVGLYPLLAGGVMGFLLRRIPLQNAA